MDARVLPGVALVALVLSACISTRSEPPSAVAPMAAAPAPSAALGPVIDGPVLGPDGRCTGTPAGTAAAIEPGITECDLVRLKGKPATDVLVGESGKGQREVQVLYSEPGGRELYFFVNNSLDRVVKP
ncbi:hypothetical protein [Microvirga splendida]|uniref:Beta-barrel assembly machine subunit BamE n=1 Tax=Microvirga splendida TaxID=2795727 RepID=A0ABS0Y0A9_9HYPH|nr:hypothetical protein [Microvirga splendida]MBJ6125747.1 hypothetical protein [Microvirga splendida]